MSSDSILHTTLTAGLAGAFSRWHGLHDVLDACLA